MVFEEVLQKIVALAESQFANERIGISADTSASDISSWDSLNHVIFMTNIEKAFEVKFDLLQMIDMKSIEDIAKAIHKMLN